jgi:uncharacterized protein YciI
MIPALAMAIALTPGLFPNVYAVKSTEDGSTVLQPKQFFVQLFGTRDGWPENMSTTEEEVMLEHFEYLKDLTNKHKVLMAGPCFAPVFGLVILQSDSEEEAITIMEKEPSVVSGIHTYKMQPMWVSLMAGNEK